MSYTKLTTIEKLLSKDFKIKITPASIKQYAELFNNNVRTKKEIQDNIPNMEGEIESIITYHFDKIMEEIYEVFENNVEKSVEDEENNDEDKE